MTFLYIILGLVLILGGWVLLVYNRLIKYSFRAEEALSDIDVQLKRRFDLIPNLVEAVKGYMNHERGVLEKVTEARAMVAKTEGDPMKREKEENILSGTLKTLFAVAENYPDLKANANFLDLQRELADTENKIQASRRFYNTTVMEYNTAIKTVPTSIVAGWFKFISKPFFEAQGKEREVVKVNFNK